MGVAEVFEEIATKKTGFLKLLFLRVKQFEIRIRSYGMRAGEDLSSLIEENRYLNVTKLITCLFTIIEKMDVISNMILNLF